MSGPESVPRRRPAPEATDDPEAIWDRSEYRLGRERPVRSRVNAGLRTEACETKPICRGPATSPPVAGPKRANKANSPHRQKRAPTGEVAGGPSLGPAVQTNPIWRHRQRRARAGEGADGTVAQADCVKRTQLAPRRPERALLPRPQPLPSLGTSAPNEANSRWSGSRGRGPARSPMPTPPGQSVRNKANPARTTRKTSAL